MKELDLKKIFSKLSHIKALASDGSISKQKTKTHQK